MLGIFSDGKDSWGIVGVAADILQACVQCIIDGLEWKLRGERKHETSRPSLGCHRNAAVR